MYGEFKFVTDVSKVPMLWPHSLSTWGAAHISLCYLQSFPHTLCTQSGRTGLTRLAILLMRWRPQVYSPVNSQWREKVPVTSPFDIRCSCLSHNSKWGSLRAWGHCKINTAPWDQSNCHFCCWESGMFATTNEQHIQVHLFHVWIVNDTHSLLFECLER